MEQYVTNAAEGIEAIGMKTKDIQMFIQDESSIIINWEKSGNDLGNKIDHVKEASLVRLELKRKSLTHDLEILHNVAKEFWDMPDGIFNGFKTPENKKEEL